MRRAAATTSLALSALFVVVYSGTNWLTGRRADVGMCRFEWERSIPFVPLMIVPYLSIDLFFVGAPFLCRDRRALRTLSQRITFAILVAGMFFVLLPLRLDFARLDAGGALGRALAAFRTLDAPYNLVPSLHACLGLVLALSYDAGTRGWMRRAARAWFVLIALSTLLTHQHHVVDVASGLALGAVCCLAFPLAGEVRPAKNLRVGSYYAVAAGALLALAARGGAWVLLVWPAVATGTVAAAYAGLGPRVFRKRNGRLAWSTRLVLWPVLVGQYLSWIYYRRRSRPWDGLVPGVMIGRRLKHAEAEDLCRRGVTAVLDLTAEFSEAAPLLGRAYRQIPILDLTAPAPSQLEEAVAFISEQAAGGTVYVHCKIGYSRTAAAVGAYLMSSGLAQSADQAVKILKKARPAMIVRPEAWSMLRAFGRSRTMPPRAA